MLPSCPGSVSCWCSCTLLGLSPSFQRQGQFLEVLRKYSPPSEPRCGWDVMKQ